MFVLENLSQGLSIVDTDNTFKPLCIDFFSPKSQHRLKSHGVKQDLAKACGLKSGQKTPLSVLDLTAGLAVDAFLLAYLNATVTLIEREASVHALVGDALTRKMSPPEFYNKLDEAIWQRTIEARERMTLASTQDAQQFLASSMQGDFDCIYYDPMFPERKKAAKVKEGMQFFHSLIGLSESYELEQAQLLFQALSKAGKRVVVKRPKGAPMLGFDKDKEALSDLNQPCPMPNYEVKSKALRYDIYLC